MENPDDLLCIISCSSCWEWLVYWISKLQTEITVSTREAKYITLSTAMHDLIPLQTFIHEMNKYVLPCHIFSNVFKDNNDALILAMTPCMMP